MDDITEELEDFAMNVNSDSLDKDETILAVITTYRDGTIERHCADCEKARFTPTPKSDRELLRTIEEFAVSDVKRIDVLTEEYDDLWSENGDLFLGKICTDCKTPLGYWHVCKFCGVVSWPGYSEHTCMNFSVEDEPEPGFYEAVMNGFEEGYQEDGFTEDVC